MNVQSPFDWQTRQPSIFMPATAANAAGKQVRTKSEAQQLRVAQGNGTKGKGRGIKISTNAKK